MALKRILTDNTQLQLIQDNVSESLTSLDGPMNGGVLLSDISLTSGQDNLVQHTLNRTPQIYFIGNLKVQSTIWSPTTASLNGSNVSTTYINLRCSTTCVVSVWIN